jgi:hypothetical protein
MQAIKPSSKKWNTWNFQECVKRVSLGNGIGYSGVTNVPYDCDTTFLYLSSIINNVTQLIHRVNKNTTLVQLHCSR